MEVVLRREDGTLDGLHVPRGAWYAEEIILLLVRAEIGRLLLPGIRDLVEPVDSLLRSLEDAELVQRLGDAAAIGGVANLVQVRAEVRCGDHD